MKRAQTSVFILIGVFVLLVVAILISQIDTVTTSDDVERIVSEQVPEEFAVLKQYVEKCLSDVSREGLELLGLQGGYINPDAFNMNTQSFSPTDADGVYLTPNSDIFMPYWFHLSSDNSCDGTCEFSSHKLLLESTESEPVSVTSELENYITLGVNDCVADFRSLRDTNFDISRVGNIEPTVYFRQEDVRVYLDFPLTVTNELDTVIVSQYETVVDVPFRKLYEQATILAQVLSQYRYYESALLNLISSYSGTTSDKLPPFFTSTSDPVETAFWISSEVENKVKEINTIFLNSVQLNPSRNYESFGENTGTNFYRFLTIPLNFTEPVYQGRFDDFTFTSIYKPEWDIYFELNDGAQIIRPSSLYVSLFSFMAVNEFRTQYSISHPIIISLSDPDALQQDGYSFNFALESNIRYNRPLNSTFERDTFLLDEIAASNMSDGDTLFCENNQRNSLPINGTVIDSSTGDVIEEAVLTYTCGSESCEITTSDSDGFFQSHFPVCMGGFLTAFKQGYQTEIRSLSTSIERSKAVGNISLNPVKTINVSIQKKLATYNTFNRSWTFEDSVRDLSLDEVATVVLTQVGIPDFVNPHTTMFSINGKQDLNSINTIQLVPGIYKVEGTINDLGEYSIPSSRRCKKRKCHTIPAMDLDARLSAGVYFTEATRYMRVSEENLYNSSEILFYATGYDLPSIPYINRRVEHLNVMGDELELFAQHMDDLIPEFKQNE